MPITRPDCSAVEFQLVTVYDHSGIESRALLRIYSSHSSFYGPRRLRYTSNDIYSISVCL